MNALQINVWMFILTLLCGGAACLGIITILNGMTIRVDEPNNLIIGFVFLIIALVLGAWALNV
jgi:high-affinity Fe2+/Pb2+ permease